MNIRWRFRAKIAWNHAADCKVKNGISVYYLFFIRYIPLAKKLRVRSKALSASG